MARRRPLRPRAAGCSQPLPYVTGLPPNSSRLGICRPRTWADGSRAPLSALPMLDGYPRAPDAGGGSERGAACPGPQSCIRPLPEQEVPTPSPPRPHLSLSEAPQPAGSSPRCLVAMVSEEGWIPEKHPKIHTSSPPLPHSLFPMSKPPFVQPRPVPLPPAAAQERRRSRRQRVQEVSQGTPAQPV